MVILSWIGQIILFFVVWRVFHWLTVRAAREMMLRSLVVQMIMNLVVALVFLIILHTLHSIWWTMAILAAGIGILTGLVQVQREN
ncbi:MAG: hypothetical protein IRZ10_12150 [Thermoflavifilum sp.]|nr:hypothetical protein [Thermoflavifilum sp.]MCL6515152.1 hypothetical protein [Alicyclobacillus sp.]